MAWQVKSVAPFSCHIDSRRKGDGVDQSMRPAAAYVTRPSRTARHADGGIEMIESVNQPSRNPIDALLAEIFGLTEKRKPGSLEGSAERATERRRTARW